MLSIKNRAVATSLFANFQPRPLTGRDASSALKTELMPSFGTCFIIDVDMDLSILEPYREVRHDISKVARSKRDQGRIKVL